MSDARPRLSSIVVGVQRTGRFRRLLLIPILIPPVVILILALQITTYASRASPGPADAAIVLGAAVWEGHPSPVFEERIRHGIMLYESGAVRYLVFTGGVGEGDARAESEVAQEYAVALGVPPERILIETESRITYENLRGACRVMRETGLESALVVSDPLHMKRAVTIAQDIGLDASPAPTPTTRYRTWRTKSGQLAYEVFYYAGHLLSRTLGRVERCEVVVE